jgi:steroid delta-isomerase-like uncharacterized protein
MPLAFLFAPSPAMSAEAYDQAIARLEQAGAGNPPGRLYHACFGDPANLRVFDVWETREDFDRFGQTLGPIMQELGVAPGQPEVTEVRNTINGAAAAAASATAPAASHVDTHRAAHDAFNRRDMHAAVRNFRPDTEITDHARSLTTKGPAEFIDWLQGWVDAFSDAKVDEPSYIDGGDYTVARFQGRGTNNGPMGNLPATGHRLDVAFCEVLHYDSSGRIASGELYYDSLGMMFQLGHLNPPMTG